MLFNIETATTVRIVPIITCKPICSPKNIALKPMAKNGTKKMKELTSFVPSFSMPMK